MGKPGRILRIGNAQAFWGDRAGAAAEMLGQDPDLDYLTLDYLAEVSMSILAIQRERDPQAGYARDFVEVIRSLAPYWASGGSCRVIANAGGLNPHGCAEACRRALEEAGCRSLKIGVVSGDSVLDALRATSDDDAANSFRNLDSDAPISDVRDRLVTANAYVGAAPIVEALAEGADIVITGRVADPSLVVAPCIHEFGWKENDWNRLAGATVAGHLIECGTQVTGGISTDWLDVPEVDHIGFPIVEVSNDGSCVVTKPRGSGGRVTAMTVKEQLVYEIGDPENYMSPDVAVSFLSLAVEDLGDDRVRVSGAAGRKRPDTYKVSATFRDGFRAAGMLTIIGRDAVAKADRTGLLLQRRMRDVGFNPSVTAEWIGSAEAYGEAILRIAVESKTREPVEWFSRELIPFVTAGAQGTTGYAEGRPRVHPVFRYWPCLIERDKVRPVVEVLQSVKTVAKGSGSTWKRSRRELPKAPEVLLTHRMTAGPATLFDIACARSGDKGTSANVGVIARNAKAWEFLRPWLTSERVAMFLASLRIDSIERFELPNLQAINFVLRGVLRNNLKTDAQGKAIGQMLLGMQLPADAMRKTKGSG